jgi:DNA-binding CsgD family transcriptional regulator
VLGPDLVRLAVQAGDDERAREVALAVEALAAANQVPSMTGAALRCRGLADDDAAILEDAVTACAAGPRPLELALAAADAGVAFGKQGRTDAARGLLDRASGLFERLDATRDLARTDAALRALGIRRGRRGPRQRPRTGWASLTPTELTVASLVVEGLTNPQIGARLFLSRRTAQTHLAHIFAKLDIGSRAALAAEVTRHRSGPAGPRTA